MSLVAYERSFKADLLPHVVFKIILSDNGDIWVDRWMKTFVLGCTLIVVEEENSIARIVMYK